jgi:hypothetical protein
MLVEKSAKPTQSGFLRRWLTDEFFDLIVWYEPGGVMHGFQLCYDKPGQERAFTWMIDRGFTHAVVDGGDFGPKNNRTPILTMGGVFPAAMVREQFLGRSAEVEPAIRELVLVKLDEFTAAAGTVR